MTAQVFSILVLGHGEMGRTMEYLLAARHRLAVWERDLQTWSENMPLEEAADGRDFVLFTLPANPHLELAGRLRDRIPEHCICLSIAKGLDEQGRTPAAALAEGLGPARRFGMVYGPMIAEELRAGRAGFAELGTEDSGVFAESRSLFSGSALHLRHSTDVIGVSWAVILKNVYVPLLGAADELELGDNVRGWLIAAALDEIARIVESLGGRRETAYGLAGIADLITTATSAGSHHRRIGRELVRGEYTNTGDAIDVRGEGVHTLAMINRFGLLDPAGLPLMQLARDLLRAPGGFKADLERCVDEAFSARVSPDG